jgi:vacuolar-type H+-ATPase subunit E/Vma4
VQCQKEFNESSTIQTNIAVNERQYLDESDLGGIEVSSNNGRIVCNNTLAARLGHSMQKLLPDIRATLFTNQKPTAGLI